MFLVALTGLVLCACDNGGGGFDNRGACMAYVNTVNDLPCVSTATELNAAALCPESLNNTTCDVSGYYDCLSEAYQCMNVGGTSVLDASRATSCTMTTCR